MIREQWENLPPKYKRYGVLVVVVVVVIGAASIFSGEKEKPQRRSTEKTIRHVLTDTNTREVGLDSLSADIKLVSRENETLRKELAKIALNLSKQEPESAEREALSRDVARVQIELEKLREENKELRETSTRGSSDTDGDEEAEPKSRNRTTRSNAASTGDADELSFDMGYSSPEDVFKNAKLPTGRAPSSEDGEGGRNQPSGPKRLTIASYSSSQTDTEESEEDKKPQEVFMPAGSIITGVLLNGMDAPTGQGARKDPFPATMRIQKEAILPNRFRADIRECFLIISGYGDLSSERAYLRSETLSCVKDNGDVIETSIDAYAVGEDGKAGLRGRLVSKQGQIIAKSLAAGFMAGASEAFDVDTVPTLSLQGSGRVQYQQNEFSDTLMRGAAARGASTALDRIAQFYIDMAEGIFPVIEIDAGRQVEVIITKGSSLTVRGAKAG